MADLAASDVTVTLQNRRIGESGRREVVAKIEFGDGVDTYPSGGVPLTKGDLGLPNVIESLKIFDAEDSGGLIFKYDYENEKIRIYQAPAQTHDHDLKVIGGGTIVADGGLGADASGDLVKVEAGDLTIEGADSATDGGVLSETLAAAALSEYSGGSTVVAATDLYVEATGW